MKRSSALETHREGYSARSLKRMPYTHPNVPRRSSQSGVAWAQGSARREFQVRSVHSESHRLLGLASRTHRITSRTMRRAHRKATLWRFCAFGGAKCACLRLYLRKRAGHAGARTSEQRRQRQVETDSLFDARRRLWRAARR